MENRLAHHVVQGHEVSMGGGARGGVHKGDKGQSWHPSWSCKHPENNVDICRHVRHTCHSIPKRHAGKNFESLAKRRVLASSGSSVQLFFAIFDTLATTPPPPPLPVTRSKSDQKWTKRTIMGGAHLGLRKFQFSNFVNFVDL